MVDAQLRSVAVSRVLIVHNSADMYGASRSLVRLTAALNSRGITSVVALPVRGPLAAVLEEKGIATNILPSLSVITRDIYRSPSALLSFAFSLPASAWSIRQLVRRTRAQLVHTNTGVIVSPALGALLGGVPHVWHIRDWFQEFRRIWPFFDRYVRGLSDRVICVSAAVAGQFTADPKVVVVNNGFPLEEFEVDRMALRAAARDKWGIGGDEVVIGVVGRIKFVRKGQEVLVAAMRLLRDRGTRCRLLIVGGVAEGNEDHLTRLNVLIDDLGLRESVVFAGELADPRPAYAAMDVFVLPSAQPEPFGGVVIEAMAMHLPVVASAIGGSLEQVAHGETGFLIPPANPAALAERLEVLVRDPQLRLRFGAAGRNRVEARFTVGSMVDKIVGVYSDVLNHEN